MYRLTSDFEYFYDIQIDICAVEDAIDDSLGEDAFHDASLNNTELAAHWTDVGGEFNDTELVEGAEPPDITVWNGVYLVLSPKAFGKLESTLAPYGEFMPLTINGTTHQLFNCRRIVDVDHSKSEQDLMNGEFLGLIRIAFNNSTELTHLVCKTQFDNCSSLYASEAFKSKVKDLKLGGLLFEGLES